jgi:uncharacterized protein (DUF1697 family)
MVYIAFLRGINVGGKSIVNMVGLKRCFEQLGLSNVKTYINSGNVIFSAEQEDSDSLASRIETALDRIFDPGIRVLVKTREELQNITAAIPNTWVNDTDTRCDVLLLWQAVDDPQVLEELPTEPDIETIRYLPGAIVWYVDRSLVTKSHMTRIIGTPLYKQLTIRNVTTVRKLVTLSNEINRTPR